MPRKKLALGGENGPYKKVSSYYNKDYTPKSSELTIVTASSSSNSRHTCAHYGNRYNLESIISIHNNNHNNNNDKPIQIENDEISVDPSVLSGWSDQVLLSYMDKNRHEKLNEEDEIILGQQLNEDLFHQAQYSCPNPLLPLKKSKKQLFSSTNDKMNTIIRFRRPAPPASDSKLFMDSSKKRWSNIVQSSNNSPSLQLQERKSLEIYKIAENEDFFENNPSFESTTTTSAPSLEESSQDQSSSSSSPIKCHYMSVSDLTDSDGFLSAGTSTTSSLSTKDRISPFERRRRRFMNKNHNQILTRSNRLQQIKKRETKTTHVNPYRHNSPNSEILPQFPYDVYVSSTAATNHLLPSSSLSCSTSLFTANSSSESTSSSKYFSPSQFLQESDLSLQQNHHCTTIHKEKTKQRISNKKPIVSKSSLSDATTSNTDLNLKGNKAKTTQKDTQANFLSPCSSSFTQRNQHSLQISQSPMSNRRSKPFTTPKKTSFHSSSHLSISPHPKNNTTPSTHSMSLSPSSNEKKPIITGNTHDDLLSTSSSHVSHDYILLSIAAIVIQSHFLSYRQRTTYLKQRNSIIKVQALFRAWLVRDDIAIDNYCAIQIQRIIRGYMVRIRYEIDYFCILLLQSIARMRSIRKKYLILKSFIVYIQRIYKKKPLSNYQMTTSTPFDDNVNDMKRQVKAATLIQSNWRMYYTQLSYQWSLILIILSQSCVRRYFTRLKFLEMKFATKLIQKKWRSYIQRKRRKEKEYSKKKRDWDDAASSSSSTLSSRSSRMMFARRERIKIAIKKRNIYSKQYNI